MNLYVNFRRSSCCNGLRTGAPTKTNLIVERILKPCLFCIIIMYLFTLYPYLGRNLTFFFPLYINLVDSVFLSCNILFKHIEKAIKYNYTVG